MRDRIDRVISVSIDRKLEAEVLAELGSLHTMVPAGVDDPFRRNPCLEPVRDIGYDVEFLVR